jgi:hypothetical protein
MRFRSMLGLGACLGAVDAFVRVRRATPERSEPLVAKYS